MAEKESRLSPNAQGILERLGDNIKRARVVRNITQEEMAKRTFLSRPTLRKLERGNPSCGIETLVLVLEILGLENQLLELADPDKDSLGKRLVSRSLKSKAVKPKSVTVKGVVLGTATDLDF